MSRQMLPNSDHGSWRFCSCAARSCRVPSPSPTTDSGSAATASTATFAAAAAGPAVTVLGDVPADPCSVVSGSCAS